MDTTFSIGAPLTPFEHLMVILPTECHKSLLAEYCFQFINDHSLQSYKERTLCPRRYFLDSNYHLSCKKVLPLLPFVDVMQFKALLDDIEVSIKKSAMKLPMTDREQRRNSLVCGRIFRYDREKATEKLRLTGPLTFGVFPDVVSCIRISSPKEEMKFIPRPLDGARYTIPGFPSLKHFPFSTSLKQLGLRAFGVESPYKTLVISSRNHLDRVSEPQIEDFAASIAVQPTVFIDWPYFVEAKVCYVETRRFIHEQYHKTQHGDREMFHFDLRCLKVMKELLTLKGIDVGVVHCLVHCNPLRSMQRQENRMKIVKKWSHEIVTVPMQMIWTQDKLSHFDTRFMDQKIDKKMELRLGAVIMYIGNEHTLLGSCGKITSLSRNGTINVRVLPHLIPTKVKTVKAIIQKYLPRSPSSLNHHHGGVTAVTIHSVVNGNRPNNSGGLRSSANAVGSGVMDTMTAMQKEHESKALRSAINKQREQETLKKEQSNGVNTGNGNGNTNGNGNGTTNTNGSGTGNSGNGMNGVHNNGNSQLLEHNNGKQSFVPRVQPQPMERWYSLADAAALLNIQKIVLKRILECIFVISKNEKIQIGLRLFDFKKRLVVYGYTRIAKKFADSYIDPIHFQNLQQRRMRRRRPRYVFEISHKTLQIVTEYRSKFPGVFRIIQQKPSLVTFGSHYFAPDQIPTNFNPYIVSRVVGVSPSGLSSNFQDILDSVVMATESGDSPLETTPIDDEEKEDNLINDDVKSQNTKEEGDTVQIMKASKEDAVQRTQRLENENGNEEEQDIEDVQMQNDIPVMTPMSRLFSPRKARFPHDLDNPTAANHKNATFYKWKPDLTADATPPSVEAKEEEKVDESILSIRDAFKAKIHAMAKAKNAEHDSSSDESNNKQDTAELDGHHGSGSISSTLNVNNASGKMMGNRSGININGGNGGLSADDDMGLQYVVQVQEWLTRLGMNELALISASSIVIPPAALAEIEAEISRLYRDRQVHTKTNHVVRLEKVPIHHVYAADPVVPWSPTPRRLWSLGDRCCSLRSDASVPFGSTGTVIGIHAEFVEVLMDKECLCGTNLCHKVSDLKGVLLSYDTVINISTSFQSYRNNDLIPIDSFPRSRRHLQTAFTNATASNYYHHQRHRNYYHHPMQGGNQRFMSQSHAASSNMNGNHAADRYRRERYYNNPSRVSNNQQQARSMREQHDIRRREMLYRGQAQQSQRRLSDREFHRLPPFSPLPMSDNRNRHRSSPVNESVDAQQRSRVGERNERQNDNNNGADNRRMMMERRASNPRALPTDGILQFQQFQQFLMQQPLYLPPDSHEQRECNLSLK